MGGLNYSRIGFLEGNNHQNGGNFAYTFTDNNLQKGTTYYYRLQQIDLNGVTSYSAIRNLMLAGDHAKLLVYPSPVKNTAHLYSAKTLSASMALFAANGKMVWQQGKKTIAGNLDIPMGNLPAGIYLLQVQQDGSQQTFKIIKE